MSAFRTSYPAFTTGGERPLLVGGKLLTPVDAPPAPAVLICHGSDGVDARGTFHAEALNRAGIATFEIDMWAARGVARGAQARPRSPIDTLPEAFAATRLMAAQPEIDAGRIGVVGFSWGAVVSLLMATRRSREKLGEGAPAITAHAALYPVCWAYETVPGLSLAELTGAPILIQTGDEDTYDDPDGLDQLLARLPQASRAVIRGVTHQGAGHGFDRDAPARTIEDPFAHKGQGGPVLMAFHPEAARAAIEIEVGFFREA
ncbi:MAG TPA: dienelactone hydrolase family protein, partial [Caulobacteraceae bacterium]|nr:dienelactone hydrolase family protein [Caulobacteraceae bacterium]